MCIQYLSQCRCLTSNLFPMTSVNSLLCSLFRSSDQNPPLLWIKNTLEEHTWQCFRQWEMVHQSVIHSPTMCAQTRDFSCVWPTTLYIVFFPGMSSRIFKLLYINKKTCVRRGGSRKGQCLLCGLLSANFHCSFYITLWVALVVLCVCIFWSLERCVGWP